MRPKPKNQDNVTYPAKNIPIGSKRTRGRPALAKPALVRKPFISIMDDSEETTPDDTDSHTQDIFKKYIN